MERIKLSDANHYLDICNEYLFTQGCKRKLILCKAYGYYIIELSCLNSSGRIHIFSGTLKECYNILRCYEFITSYILADKSYLGGD